MRSNQSVLGLTTAVLGAVTGVLKQLRPDRVLVHGDTPTPFATALACFYARIPIGHVEAGLRTRNLYAPWPEEFNRCAVDLVADLLWAPTTRAAESLRGSLAAGQAVVVTGNTVIDALELACRRLDTNPDLHRQTCAACRPSTHARSSSWLLGIAEKVSKAGSRQSAEPSMCSRST
jgi:UDP-N-acetylglucosamine 2-epimerase